MAAWLRELALGARLARSGGRSSLARLTLTAVGVGLGVALLLVAASVPRMVDARDERTSARSDFTWVSSDGPLRPGPGTLLTADANTDFRDAPIRGRIVMPEGPRAPLPPGISRWPASGELVVSPRLKRLLESPDGALLRERLPQPIAGTLADAGLEGPAEYAFYLRSDRLRLDSGGLVHRIDHFGARGGEGLDTTLRTLAVIALVGLLMPVAVFLAAAARFGGEARDRRLAALRMVGADVRMTRRIAAGESIVAALLGLLLGGLLFLLARGLVGYISMWGLSSFPSDVAPSPLLALLVAVLVPAAAVAVTLLALRGVAIEPLGLVRRAVPRRRRLWWRLALPCAGALLLAPLVNGRAGVRSSVHEYQLAAGAVLVLLGVAGLLPWAVEALVGRLRGGGVAWQLATRRLQLDSGTSARVVSGIAVAVAGAIALQTAFSGVEDNYVKNAGVAAEQAAGLRAGLSLTPPRGTSAAAVAAQLRGVAGVRELLAVEDLRILDRNGVLDTLRIASCPTLRGLTRLRSCRDGEVFDVGAGAPLGRGAVARIEGGPRWTVPRDVRAAEPRAGFDGISVTGLAATPGALRGVALPNGSVTAWATLDPGAPDALDRLRNAALAADPLATVFETQTRSFRSRYANLRRALFAGAVAVLVLIGASMLVGVVEQLRERRRPLAVLVAFGTPRAAIARSILWQTAIPVCLGLTLAVAAGAGLGAALLRMVGEPVAFDLASIAGMAAAGGAVVLLVTALSLPALRRTMRPEGLRTE